MFFISSVQQRRLRFKKSSDLLAFAAIWLMWLFHFILGLLQISTPRYECEFVSCRIVLWVSNCSEWVVWNLLFWVRNICLHWISYTISFPSYTVGQGPFGGSRRLRLCLRFCKERSRQQKDARWRWFGLQCH